MGMKLNDLRSSHHLSGCDLVLVREEQPAGGTKNSYRIEKSNSFQRTVRFIKYHVSGSYRNSVMEMRRDALRDLEKFGPIADARACGTADDKGVNGEIEARLARLQTHGVNFRKFVKEVQSLAKFVEEEGTVFSSAKRNAWTDKSSSLSVDECRRYIRADGWNMKFDKNWSRRLEGTGEELLPNRLCGRAALDCMTSVLFSDGVLQPHIDKDESGIIPDSVVLGDQSILEKQERVSTAMAFLKFLTIESHDEINGALFKWSGHKDVSSADKAKFTVTSFHGMKKPTKFPASSKPFLNILTPEKALQQHVVNLLNKFSYKEGKGLVIDKRELRTMPQGPEGELTPQQREWVANKLLEFLS